MFTGLLWLVVTHHCALEDTVSYFLGAASTLNNSNSDEDHCPAHSNEDPASHSEGQLCGTSVFIEARNIKLKISLPTFTPAFFRALDSLPHALMANYDANLFSELRQSELIPAASQLANSLSLAPNAPPLDLV